MSNLFEKYLTGNCVPEEKKKIEADLFSNSPSVYILGALKKYWYRLESDETEYKGLDFEGTLHKIHHTINLHDSQAHKFEFRFVKQFYLWTRLAAAILLVLLVSGGVWFIGHNGLFQEEVFHTFTSVRGQSSMVTLPDGTRVWLNGESSLKYSSNYGRTSRNVNLSGEGFFKVKKNKDLPFVVNACEVKVTALGTSFNIDAYSPGNQVVITLEEGRVKTESMDLSEILDPGMQLIAKKNQFEIKHVDTEIFTSWHRGKIVFKNETLETITNQMGKMYDVNFVFKNDTLKSFRYRGTIQLDNSILKAMEKLSISTNIEYEVKGNNVYLMK